MKQQSNDTQLLNQVATALLTQVERGTNRQDPYKPTWHVSAPVGLLNDPNGLSQYRGVYHLFYQWYPLDTDHGPKFWGLVTSTDLVNWSHQPVALAPSQAYETHGCYSGSAIEVDGELELFYTGNVKFDDGGRTAYQVRATHNPSGLATKQGPVLDLPAGYSGHVRDPKVWQRGDHYYMVLGAQDLNMRGVTLLYRGDDLDNWHLLGEVAGCDMHGLDNLGHMWECPDLFELDGQGVLIFSPKSAQAADHPDDETFDCGYVTGELDLDGCRFAHGAYAELDHGWDFYAPQTTEDDQGRRLLFAWMGKPDHNEAFHPTRAFGWIHQMSCPRELTLVDGKLYQNPASELQAMRQQGTEYQGGAAEVPTLDAHSAEIIITGESDYELNLSDTVKIRVSEQGLELSRINWRSKAWEAKQWQGTVERVQILTDVSGLEIFVNSGEATFSARYFIEQNRPARVEFSGSAQIDVKHWLLKR